jgi:hypothetical protein
MIDAYFSAFADALLRSDAADPPACFQGLWDDGYQAHHRNFKGGLVTVLMEAYPTVKAMVGDEFFAMLASRFVAVHPPKSPILSRYGEEFGAFVGTVSELAAYPYVPDVARLEYAVGRAFHAEDRAPLAISDLLDAQSNDADDLLLEIHPSAQVVVSAHPIVAIWELHHDEKQVIPEEEWKPEAALVLRPRLDVQVGRISHELAAFISALRDDGSLAKAIEIGFSVNPDFRPDEVLAFLIGEGAICGAAPA